MYIVPETASEGEKYFYIAELLKYLTNTDFEWTASVRDGKVYKVDTIGVKAVSYGTRRTN